MKKMRVAIIGQGRSGRDIHGRYFLSKENDNVEVVYVVDEVKERREKGYRKTIRKTENGIFLYF